MNDPPHTGGLKFVDPPRPAKSAYMLLNYCYYRLVWRYADMPSCYIQKSMITNVQVLFITIYCENRHGLSNVFNHLSDKIVVYGVVRPET